MHETHEDMQDGNSRKSLRGWLIFLFHGFVIGFCIVALFICMMFGTLLWDWLSMPGREDAEKALALTIDELRGHDSPEIEVDYPYILDEDLKSEYQIEFGGQRVGPSWEFTVIFPSGHRYMFDLYSQTPGWFVHVSALTIQVDEPSE